MLVAYLYDINNQIIAQFLKISNFQCRKILNDIGTSTFSISPKEEGISLVQEFLRVKVNWLSDGQEKTIFDGVIRQITATKDTVTITLNDFLYLLKKKKIYSSKSYTGVSVKTVLTEILGEINARYDTGITLQTSVTSAISKEYKDFLSLYDILKDMANSGYEFDIVDKVLIFTIQLGADRTIDPDLVEFRSDVAIPREMNISDYSLTRDAENLSNAVTGISNIANTQTDATSIAKYGRIEEAYTVDGDVANATTKLLADHKDSVTEISVSPLSNDFFAADMGDKVKVYIDGGNDLQFFDGNLRVVEKGMTFSTTPVVDIKLSTTRVFTPTLLDTIKDLRNRVKKMEV